LIKEEDKTMLKKLPVGIQNLLEVKKFLNSLFYEFLTRGKNDL